MEEKKNQLSKQSSTFSVNHRNASVSNHGSSLNDHNSHERALNFAVSVASL